MLNAIARSTTKLLRRSYTNQMKNRNKTTAIATASNYNKEYHWNHLNIALTTMIASAGVAVFVSAEEDINNNNNNTNAKPDDNIYNKQQQQEQQEPPAPKKKPMTRRKLARRNSRRRQRRHYPYVIIGGGTTSYAAIEAIRQIQPDANILMISDEPALPRADVDDDSDFFECNSLLSIYNEYRRHISSRLETEPDAYSSKPITLLLGRRKLHLDAESRTVVLLDGSRITYDKCLLASAGDPRDLYVLDNNQIPFTLRENINTLTKLQHFVDLDASLRNDGVEHLTVVGGGFLGTEMACSVMDHVNSGRIQVSHVMVETGPLQRYLPRYLSQYIGRQMRENLGIDIISDRLVTGLSHNKRNNSKNKNEKVVEPLRPVVVDISGYENEKLETDYVLLASTHITPNTRVGEESGLEIDSTNGGIVVNGAFESMNGLYIAGNLASYYDAAIGRRRVDRYDHAVNSGLLAGKNMAMTNMENNKEQSLYRHQPSFKSELRGLGVTIEGVGIIDSKLTTIGVWLANRDKETNEILERTPTSDFQRGVVYYLKDNVVVGVILWNASDQMNKAREIVNDKKILNQSNVANELQKMISLAPEESLDIIQS